jgi:hypothetical protein
VIVRDGEAPPGYNEGVTRTRSSAPMAQNPFDTDLLIRNGRGGQHDGPIAAPGAIRQAVEALGTEVTNDQAVAWVTEHHPLVPTPAKSLVAVLRAKVKRERMKEREQEDATAPEEDRSPGPVSSTPCAEDRQLVNCRFCPCGRSIYSQKRGQAMRRTLLVAAGAAFAAAGAVFVFYPPSTTADPGKQETARATRPESVELPNEG